MGAEGSSLPSIRALPPVRLTEPWSGALSELPVKGVADGKDPGPRGRAAGRNSVVGIVKETTDLFGQLAGVFRRIPLLDDFLDEVRRRYFSPVVVRRIKDPRNPDLPAALELYEQRIPDTQRFEAEDIVRWLSEDKETDCFLIAKFHKKVCGFCLFHYYPARGLGLFAYMVVAKRPGIPANEVSNALMRRVSRFLNKRGNRLYFKGLVLEVEDPRRLTGEQRRESLARVRRFCTLASLGRFAIRAIDIAYKQPPLTHSETDLHQEELLLLLAAPTNGVKTEIDKSTLVEIVDFIYLALYPEGYSADLEECERYKDKCKNLRDDLVRQVPEKTRLLSLPELAQVCANSTARKAKHER